MANDLPVEQDAKEFEVIKVEGEEPKFGEVLEFVFESRSAIQIIDFIRTTYEFSTDELPLHSESTGDLANYYTVEFDDQAQDGQELFNIYSPQDSTVAFKMPDLEKVFNELANFVDNNTKLNVSFLLVSFLGEKDLKPSRIDVLSIPKGVKFDQQNTLTKRMEEIASTGATKLLALKLVKPII